MTAFSFILRVVPLVTAVGAASGSRRSLGTAVFGGMSAATIMTLLVTPVLFRIFQGLVGKRGQGEPDGPAEPDPAPQLGAPPTPPPAAAPGDAS